MTPIRSKTRIALSFVGCLILLGATANAQTGVSDDRVSLPEGPGSLEGVGENVDIDPNMGHMNYAVPIDVPQGFSGVMPELALSYSSGSGSGELGIGWSMSLPNIERMTYRGLPEYDRDDDFAADGGQQLVLIPGTEPPVYRVRQEKSFVRYTWHVSEDGDSGYWTAEYPDGRVGYFGADQDGNRVDAAHVYGDEGTFRYHLVEMVDVFGHSMRLTWRKGEGERYAYIQRIGYIYLGGAEPRYSMTFGFEPRSDSSGVDILSDAKPGFNERITERLASINIFSGSDRIRRYALTYETYAQSGGFTRLLRVEKFGLTNVRYPVVFDFGYSRALGGICGENDICERPFMVEMGSLGVDLGSGQATLLDINGDALPDVIHTPPGQDHRFFLNVPDENGQSRFNTTAVTSNLPTSAFQLGTPYVHVLDVNGDGFTDMINAQTSEFLRNTGQGDWEELSTIGSTETLPSFEADFDLGGENELRTIRFLDFDNDKRIDVMRAATGGTSMYRNLGDLGFVSEDGVEPLGANFETDNLQLTDMNGDGLLDLVQLFPGRLRYRFNLGRSRWADWVDIIDLPITPSNIELVELEDLNGDALSDLVIVSGSTIQYALNRNGERFFDIETISSVNVDGDIPNRIGTVRVLYADMNANGSSDIVWVDGNGLVRYLELFPVRPNLMARIENGLGQVNEITYGTSVEHMARDGGTDAWSFRLPHPMLVVDRIDKYDLLTDVHELNEFRYHDGFYNTVEKRFQGYARTETLLIGDDSQESGETANIYDVGADDFYFNGLLIAQSTSSSGRALKTMAETYEDCPLEDVPDTTELPVRFICKTETTTTIKEGAQPRDHITTRTEMEYDGYGNVIRSVEHGITAIGGEGCEACTRDAEIFGKPCGAICLGDEMTTETTYVHPDNANGRWIINAPYREIRYGRSESNLATETLTYYDGPDFEGLDLGELTHGLASRVTRNIAPGSDDVINEKRAAYDEHGNVVETLDPLGTSGGTTHRRAYVYDEEQLRVARTDIFLEDDGGQPYQLRREVQYENLFDKAIEATSWMRIVNGETNSSRRSAFFAYDGFGRIISMVKPGEDTLDSPTEVYTYALDNPSSRIIVQKRSQAGGPLDLEQIMCIDGRGREYQNRTRLASGSYQVTGLTRFNVRSNPVQEFHPYLSNTPECDTTPPEGTLFTRYRYDATFRPIESTIPDSSIYDTPSQTRTEYTPLATLNFDAEDNDPNSPHFNTPTITRANGLGLLVDIERHLVAGQPITTEVTYDTLGRLRSYIDAAGNEKIQEYDLLDRVVRILDPNTKNETIYTYDAASNETAMTDDRLITTRTVYDGMNRPIAKWDDADPDGTRVRWFYDSAPDCSPSQCTNTEGVLAQLTYPLLEVAGEKGRDTFGFDVRGRSVYTARLLEQATFETRTEFDNADRTVATIYPDGQTLTQELDDASRVTGIEGLIHSIGYTDRNQIASIGCTDGSATTYNYDAILRLEALATTNAGDVVLQGFDYQRDRLGNITSVMDTSNSSIARPDYNAQYSYDAWYRPVSANISNESINLGYDNIDNIVSKTSDQGSESSAHVGDYNYDDGPNAVTSAGAWNLSYDPAGYQSRRNDQELSWDYQGRLTHVMQGQTEQAHFLYGPDQSRVIKREGDHHVHYISRNFELRDGIASLYVRVNNKRVARLESEGLAATVLSDIAPLGNSDGIIAAGDAWLAFASSEGLIDDNIVNPSSVGRLLRSSAQRMLVETGPGVTFLHHDHRGSITLATAGDVVGQRAFYPFGNIREGSFGDVDVYSFTGQEKDASTGLYHFDWRYYDADLGRWASIDPAFGKTTGDNIVKHGESTTGYAYVGNNAMNVVDPTGLSGKDLMKQAKGMVKKTAQKLSLNRASSRSSSAGAWQQAKPSGEGRKFDIKKTNNDAIFKNVEIAESKLELRNKIDASDNRQIDLIDRLNDTISELTEFNNNAPSDVSRLEGQKQKLGSEISKEEFKYTQLQNEAAQFGGNLPTADALREQINNLLSQLSY